MLRLFLDTGPFMALHNKRDREHDTALESFDKMRDGMTSYTKLYTSDYVLDEAVTGCRYWTRNHALSVELGTLILSAESILMLRVEQDILTEAWELYKSRREIPLSLTDCTSAILMRKHGLNDIYTYDSDFGALGFRSLKSLSDDKREPANLESRKARKSFHGTARGIGSFTTRDEMKTHD